MFQANRRDQVVDSCFSPDYPALLHRPQWVFVYGSLKRGRVNAHNLKDANYWGPALTKEKDFAMNSLGVYPVLFDKKALEFYYTDVDEEAFSRVAGELYQVSAKQLSILDLLESNTVYYQREKVQCLHMYAEGRPRYIEAWMYITCPHYCLGDEEFIKSTNTTYIEGSTEPHVAQVF